jgi:hypothetical protein
VRSMAQRNSGADSRTGISTQNGEPSDESRSAVVPITGEFGDDSGLENGEDPDAPLLSGHASSAPQSSWRNFASLSFSALSGDTIWHQARTDQNR